MELKEEIKLLQFIFLLLIILIFSIFLFIALPYRYALSFDYDQKLDLSVNFSVLIFKIDFKKIGNQKLLYLEILNFKKKFKLDKLIEENAVTDFMQQKSKNFIQNKFKKFSGKDKEEKIKNKDKKKSDFKFPFSLISKENLSHLFQFITNLIKRLKPDHLKLDLLFSLADPYYNGLFLAYYYTFKSLVDYPNIKAEINWQEVMFKGKGAIGGKIIPLLIIWQFIAFVFSLKTLKILWQLYKSK
jgi:hypothetical protein